MLGKEEEPTFHQCVYQSLQIGMRMEGTVLFILHLTLWNAQVYLFSFTYYWKRPPHSPAEKHANEIGGHCKAGSFLLAPEGLHSSHGQMLFHAHWSKSLIAWADGSHHPAGRPHSTVYTVGLPWNHEATCNVFGFAPILKERRKT